MTKNVSTTRHLNKQACSSWKGPRRDDSKNDKEMGGKDQVAIFKANTTDTQSNFLRSARSINNATERMMGQQGSQAERTPEALTAQENWKVGETK